MSGPPEILVCAGEASGDLIGALLIKRIKRLAPDCKIAALGGTQMRDAGAELLFDMVKDLSVVGLVEVISKLGKIRKVFNLALDRMRERPPAVLVLIDYPGFNLRLAERAHKMGIKVVYYAIPQIWAWHRSRVHKLRKYVDHAIVLFPFEEKLLREEGVPVSHPGHYLLDIMILTLDRDAVFRKFGLDPSKRLIGLLPGSRKREVESLLPVMLKAAEILSARVPNLQFVIPRAPTIKPEQIDHCLAKSSVPVTVIDSNRYNVRSQMEFALVASGTATLETGLLLCPMVILYKVAWLTAFIGRMLVKLPYFGLVNIVAEELVAPEAMQEECTPENVARLALETLENPERLAAVRERLRHVKEKMGGRGASLKAAEIILKVARGEAIAPAPRGPE